MVTIEQVKNGLTKYIDAEILPNMTGGKRFALGVCAALLVTVCRIRPLDREG